MEFETCWNEQVPKDVAIRHADHGNVSEVVFRCNISVSLNEPYCLDSESHKSLKRQIPINSIRSDAFT